MLLLAVAVFGATGAGCAADESHARDSASPEARIAGALMESFPAAVAVSPDGSRVLLKTFHLETFELEVQDRATGRVLARHRGRDTQVAPAWRPDGEAVAFLMDHDGDQAHRPFVLDVRSGRVAAVEAPPTMRGADLRWSPDGERLAYLRARRGRAGVALIVTTPGPGSSAIRLADDVAPRADFAWAPSGRVIAVVPRLAPGALLLVGLDGRRRLVPVEAGAEIREVAWSSDARLLLAVRGAGELFFAVAALSLEDGAVRRLAAPNGDVSGLVAGPGGRLVYHVDVDGELVPRTCDRGGRSCGASAGGPGVVLGLSPDGDTAFVVRRGRTAPPALHALALDGTGERVLHAPPPTAEGLAARRIDVLVPDGTRVPAYVWRARRRPGQPRSALIRVHGGPALRAGPDWDALVQHLVRSGHDVVLPNYRGSTGYGAAFERAPGGTAARVRDVLAVRDWVADSLGVPADRIVVFGHSYGAALAAAAVAREPEGFGGAVLVSLVAPEEVDAEGGSIAARRVVAFHGENDALLPPDDALPDLARLLCRRAGPFPRRGCVRVVAGEGHNFHRVSSWAAVYAATTRMLEGAQP